MINKCRRETFFYLLSSAILFICIACEDDPLLEPQNDNEVDQGSYGMLYLSDEDDYSIDETNPEVY